MSFREFINYDPIERVRIPEQRDLINGIRCNRNERVEYWDKEFVDSLFSNINNVDFSLYPDLSVLYKVLASYANINYRWIWFYRFIIILLYLCILN